MIKQIFSAVMITAFTLSGSELQIIHKGNIKSAIVTPPKWIKYRGFIEFTGPNVFVASKYSLKPGTPFKIRAKIAIEKLNGTAAALTINGNKLGFDGAGNKMFIEGPELGTDKKISRMENPIKSDIPFNLEVESDGKLLTMKINSHLIFKKAFLIKSKVTIALRPHRSKMKIYNFHLQGTGGVRNTVADISGVRPPMGTCIVAFDILKDVVVSYKIPGSKWSGKLKSGKKSLPLNTVYKNGSIQITISKKLLQQAYQATSGKYNLKKIRITLRNDKNTSVRKYILCYDSKQCQGFRKTTVKMIKGAPAIYANGHPEGILLGRFAMMRDRYRATDVRDFDRIGARENIILLIPRQFYSRGRFQQKQFDDYIEKICLRIVKDAPKSSISIVCGFYTNKEWGEQYPDELIVTDPKVKHFRHPGVIQPSYASTVWRKYAVDILTNTLTKLQKSPLADRVESIKVGYGNCGEWNNFGYHEKVFPDVSVPMQKAFGSWLKNKYQSNSKLQKAWNRRNASFDSGNVVPGTQARMNNSAGTFRIYPGGRQASDYYEFWQEYTVDTIEFLAKTVKEVTNGKILVGAYYGYFPGHISGSPYHFQDSGHYAFGRYLRSPYLDFVSGPYPYNNRRKNSPINGAFSSVKLHGKLWNSENDQRTHRSGKSNLRYGTTASLAESIAIAKRDFMQNLAKGGSYYFMDFVFGWYQDKQFMKTLGRLKKIDKFALKYGRKSIAQVAVLLDESVVPMISNQSKRAMIELNKMLVYNLDATGAPWDCYLMSDLENIDFSQYKLVIMANLYHMNKKKRQAVKKYLYNKNRSVLYMYAPGIIDKNGKADYQAAAELTGLKFIPAKNIVEMPFSPLWTAVLNNIQVLKYFRNKIPAVVTKSFPNHKIFFATAPGVSSATLSLIYNKAGIHSYTAPGDSLFACQNLIGIYSRNGGIKNINLPRKAEIIYDFFTKKVLARKKQKITINMPQRTSSIILYAGPEENIAKFLKANIIK
jgi:hypothetical protein